VPDDVALVEELVDLIAADGAATLAIVVDESIYGRELASAVARRARQAGVEPVETVEDLDEEESARGMARDLADERPSAIVYAGTPGEAFAPLLDALAAELPGARVWGAAGLAAADAPDAGPGFSYLSPLLPPEEYSHRGRKLLRRIGGEREALYGYAAVRTVLDAIEASGGDRIAVLRAALAEGGPASPNRSRARFALYGAGAGGMEYERVVP
jgi:ABC-type branched-subunit amino acid transport system substrate-binding protein